MQEVCFVFLFVRNHCGLYKFLPLQKFELKWLGDGAVRDYWLVYGGALNVMQHGWKFFNFCMPI